MACPGTDQIISHFSGAYFAQTPSHHRKPETHTCPGSLSAWHLPDVAYSHGSCPVYTSCFRVHMHLLPDTGFFIIWGLGFDSYLKKSRDSCIQCSVWHGQYDVYVSIVHMHSKYGNCLLTPQHSVFDWLSVNSSSQNSPVCRFNQCLTEYFIPIPTSVNSTLYSVHAIYPLCCICMLLYLCFLLHTIPQV